MDTRDSIQFSDGPYGSRRPSDDARRGRPAQGRAWSPVVVGAPVRPGRWVDLTEEDFDDPLSGVYPQVDGSWVETGQRPYDHSADGYINEDYPGDGFVDEGVVDHRVVDRQVADSAYVDDGYAHEQHVDGAYVWNGYEWILQVPEVVSADQFEQPGYESDGYAPSGRAAGDPPAPWWEVPIWKPPRVFFVIGALAITLIAWPLSKGSEVDRAGAATGEGPNGSVPIAGGGDSTGAGSFGRQWSAEVPGVLTFLGNPSRSFNGSGPLPADPRVVDRYDPAGSGAGPSSQTLIAEREGRTWAITAGLDGKVGFSDADTGEQLLSPLETSRPIRATPTLDPDGYPLLYVGGDDGELRVVALDRGGTPDVVWSLRASSVSPSQWGTDWSGSPLLSGDRLVVGGGNSNLHVIKLNRSMDAGGRVRVDPKLEAHIPTWDDELNVVLGDRETGVDASIAMGDSIAWVVNGGGLLTGWDLSPLDRGGQPTRVLRFWAGDAVKTSIALDETGAIYLATAGHRRNGRVDELGRVMKLDPSRPDDPLVWSSTEAGLSESGVVGAPVITAGLVVVTGEQGELAGFDRATGEVLWVRQIQAPARATPVMVDDAMVLGSCDGLLRAWDLSSEGPEERWSVNVGGCVEAPVTAWKGRLFVPQRDGGLAVVGDAAAG